MSEASGDMIGKTEGKERVGCRQDKKYMLVKVKAERYHVKGALICMTS